MTLPLCPAGFDKEVVQENVQKWLKEIYEKLGNSTAVRFLEAESPAKSQESKGVDSMMDIESVPEPEAKVCVGLCPRESWIRLCV